MDAETQRKLREKFDVAQIGYKPKPYCKACKASQSGACQSHERKRCPKCKQNITTQHIDVEFVGHADVTHRLLEVDPEWSWEPVGFDERGLPALDANGGLWIRLTVAGMTRIGYGGADGKEGDDAVKEAISDAIKVTAMRFGVGLDLWRKQEASGKTSDEPQQQARNDRQAPPQNGHVEDSAPAARKSLAAHCERMGYDLHAVAAKFRDKYRQELGEATDATRVRAFTKLLDGMPELELKANGAKA